MDNAARMKILNVSFVLIIDNVLCALVSVLSKCCGKRSVLSLAYGRFSDFRHVDATCSLYGSREWLAVDTADYDSSHQLSFLQRRIKMMKLRSGRDYSGDQSEDSEKLEKADCSYCKKPVENEEQGIKCTDCTLWIHSRCVAELDDQGEVTSEVYE